MPVISLSISEREARAIKEYCAASGFGTLQKGIRALVEQALDNDGTVERRLEAVEQSVRDLQGMLERDREAYSDLETRLIKTASKGTKASLASLIALSTYLPPVGNLVDSVSYITMEAWRRLGFEIEDQVLTRDQAALLEWRDKERGEFLDFCWKAAGRASRKGAAVDYASLTHGLHDYSYIDSLDDAPQVVRDILDDQAALSESLGDELAGRWGELQDTREHLRSRVEGGTATDFEEAYYHDVSQAIEALRETMRARQYMTIKKQTSEQVPDADGGGTIGGWFAETVRLDPAELLGGQAEQPAWSWFVDNLDEGEILENLQYRKSRGLPMPAGYDGSFDDRVRG
jgi:hypothetical protein